jgi:hypothetical protein
VNAQTEGKKPVADLTIYVTKEQRQLMDRLLVEAKSLDIDLLDNRGNPSYSKLIRMALTSLDQHFREIREGQGG